MTKPTLDIAPLDIGPDWFNKLFDEIGVPAVVESLTSKSIGTGQIGENVRFVFEYASGKGPQTLVGKFPSSSQDSLNAAKMLGHYEREVMVYRTFSGVTDRIAPAALYTDFEAETNRFALIMQDMAPAQQGDQLAGCGPEAAKRALAAAAVLHAAHWEDPELDTFPWLQGSATAPPPLIGPEMVAGLWEGFKDRYAEHLAAEDIEVGDAFAQALPTYGDRYTGPFTLTHNDFRLDNMLFGSSASPKTLAVVDWQTAAKGGPMNDVAYFIGAGLTRADRPEYEGDLLKFYYECLAGEGVRNYSMDDLQRDYRWFSFYGMSVAFAAAMLVKQTERGDEMFLTMLRRHAAQARDNDALTLL